MGNFLWKIRKRNVCNVSRCIAFEQFYHQKCNNGILLPKLFWPTVRKNCSSDREKHLKFEAEGQEFEISRTILIPKCSDLLWEKNVLVIKKTLKLEAEGQEFAKNLRSLNRTIYSNSESSEQFLVTEWFFNFFLEVFHI
jgi:hypothetical protein